MQASNTATITAAAGGLALSFANGRQGSSTAVAAGVAIAYNAISGDAQAIVDNSTLTWANGVAGDLTVQATSAQAIQAYTLAAAAAVAGGAQGSGIAGAGAGAGAINFIDGSTVAALRNSEVTAGTGAVSITASNSAKIDAGAGGISAALGVSTQATGAAVAFGAAFAINEIGDQGTDQTLAEISGSAVYAGGDIKVDAASMAQIFALTLGVAASGGGSTGGTALAGSLAGSLSYNKIRGNTQARVRSSTVSAGGSLSVQSQDGSSIEADAGGFALALAASGSGNAISVAVGAAVAINDISVTLQSEIDASDVINASVLTVAAIEDASINALTLVGSAAVAAGNNGFGIAGAGAGSGNSIANTVEARINASRIKLSAGSVTVTATDTSRSTPTRDRPQSPSALAVPMA